MGGKFPDFFKGVDFDKVLDLFESASVIKKNQKRSKKVKEILAKK